MLVNLGLAVVKLITGILGRSYALIADAVESAADVVSSLVVWGGLRLSLRSEDDRYPFGYGKAEPLAGATVGLLLLGAAAGISIAAARAIRAPQRPEPFTLIVLVLAIVVKEILFRHVRRVGQEVSSTAVTADAWHHRSDALTSAAAVVGIGVALLGGPGFEAADAWAAFASAGLIAINGLRILRESARDLMDRAPRAELVARIAATAAAVPGVTGIDKLRVRRAGLGVYVDIHVEADPGMSLHDAHVLSGMVKTALRAAVPETLGVLVHMEPGLKRPA